MVIERTNFLGRLKLADGGLLEEYTFIFGDFVQIISPKKEVPMAHIEDLDVLKASLGTKYPYFCKWLKTILAKYSNKVQDNEDWNIISINKAISLCEIPNTRETILTAFVEKDMMLESLSSDTNPVVRRAVAKKGFGLKEMANDEDVEVRLEVAKQAMFLDSLVDDDSPRVRAEVANQGYALEVLANDPDESVRLAVDKQVNS